MFFSKLALKIITNSLEASKLSGKPEICPKYVTNILKNTKIGLQYQYYGIAREPLRDHWGAADWLGSRMGNVWCCKFDLLADSIHFHSIAMKI